MDAIESLQREHLLLKWMVADLRLHLLRRKFARKGGYNEEQPRDELGRWTDDGSLATDLSAVRVSRAKRAALEAYCLAQYAKDTYHCTKARSRACHEQAALRYSNCLTGRPIPPLNY